MGLSLGSFSAVASGVCPEFLPRLEALLAQAPSPRETEFLNDVFYPVVGKRFVSDGYKPLLDTKTCGSHTLGCIEFPKAGGNKEVRVEWVNESSATPWVEVQDSARVLKIPKDVDFKSLPEHGRTYVQQLLIGHELHPYISSPKIRMERAEWGDAPIFLKKSQEEAIAALKDADLAGQRKLLLVSPTAWGKTEVLKAVLKQRLEKSSQKLHVIVADQNGLTEQLKKEMKDLAQTTPMRIKHWGGSGEKAGKIEDLIAEADSGKDPLVLITTIQSLKATLKKNGWSKGIEAMRPKLSTFVYDEAHHAGAPEAKELIEGLVDHPNAKATLFGMTATPVHQKVGIQQFFGDNAYWAYLDSGKSYRSVEQVVDQLSTAIQRGELTPFENTYFITPESVGVSQTLFTPNVAGRLVLNPEHYDVLFKRMQPLFAKHENGFLTVGSIEEATRLTNYLNQVTPGKRFAVLHSKLSKQEREEVQKLYHDGKINYLITVKYLDEGVRYPKMSLYVDLNANAGSRQFLQRIGRVLALEPGKEAIDVVSLMELNEAGVKEHIALIDQVLAGKFELPRPIRLSHEAKPASDGFFPESKLFSLNPEEMRTELDRIRGQLNAFWERSKLTPSLRAAIDTLSYIERSGFTEVPKQSKDVRLYDRFLRHREDSEFQAEMKKYPKAWALVEESITAAKVSPVHQAVLDTLAYIQQSRYSEVPKPSKNPNLHARFLRYRNNPEFQAEMKMYPKAWALVEESITPSAKQAALDTLAYIEESNFTEIPKESKNDALTQRFRKYREDPEFQTEMKKYPRAWALVEQSIVATKVSPAKQAMLDTLAYIERSGFTDVPSEAIDRNLARRFSKFRNDPEFQAEMKKHPKAWAMVKDFIDIANASPAKRAMLDTLAYIEESGFTDVPRTSTNPSLEMRFRKYSNDPEFQTEMKKHPKAWALVERTLAEKEARTRARAKPLK
jgi:superfamily II DNA or RNA helicase